MKNVVLIGFMGTGKTSTGKILAARLGYAFADLDKKIERQEKMTIQDIFARHGETYFRACEKAMVAKLSKRKNLVISTGGGTVKDAENIKNLRENGMIVCLTARVDTLLERTGRRGTRPVLDQGKKDRRQTIIDLLAERQTLYAHADYTLDTSDLSPLQVAEDIVGFLKRRGAFHA